MERRPLLRRDRRDLRSKGAKVLSPALALEVKWVLRRHKNWGHQALTKALTARVLATATAPRQTIARPAMSGRPSSAAVPQRSVR